jgi:hypothetical protein
MNKNTLKTLIHNALDKYELYDNHKYVFQINEMRNSRYL